MRAMKRTVSVLLSLVLVLGIMAIGISASAAETNTITVTSNIAADATATYTANSEQVTVTYELQTATKFVSTEAVITYDKTVLSLAASNTDASIVPNLTGGSYIVNRTKTDGRLPFNASEIEQGFDFTTKKVYATVVFDIIGTGDTTVNLEVKGLIASTNYPSTDPAYETSIIEDDVNDTTKYTATASAVVTPEEGPAVPFDTFLARYGSNLEGKVGLVYVFNQEPTGYDTSKLSVKFIGPDDGGTENVTVAWNDMPIFNKKQKWIRHDYSLMSTMFSQPVTAEIYYDGALVSYDTYSIEQYILDKPAPDEISRNLNYTLLNYGANAQLTFDAYTDNLANKNIDYPLQNVTANDIVLPAGVGVQPDLSSIGLQFSSEGAVLDADTAIRIFYKINEADKFATASATLNGADLPFGYVSPTRRQLYIPNISSADFDTVQTVTFSNGATYKTSILAQLKNKLTHNPDDNLAKAMYWYNQAANAYFEG